MLAAKTLEFEWILHGIDTNTLTHLGGPKCANHISNQQKIIESIFVLILSVAELIYGFSRISKHSTNRIVKPSDDQETYVRKPIVLVLGFVFGIEIGIKVATATVIWSLNPCHILTCAQLLICLLPHSVALCHVFRVLVHCSLGATLALLFPDVSERLLPFERESYYVQHGLLLLVPMFLMHVGGAFTVEPYSDLTYVSIASGVLHLYHFFFLQPVGMLIEINLNNMLCPSLFDPIGGQWYRCATIAYMHLLIPLHGKLHTLLMRSVLDFCNAYGQRVSFCRSDMLLAIRRNLSLGIPRRFSSVLTARPHSPPPSPHRAVGNGRAGGGKAHRR